MQCLGRAQGYETQKCKHGGQSDGRIDGGLGHGVDVAQPVGKRQGSVTSVGEVYASPRGVVDEDDAEVGHDGTDPQELCETAVAHRKLQYGPQGLSERRFEDGVDVGRGVSQDDVEDVSQHSNTET